MTYCPNFKPANNRLSLRVVLLRSPSAPAPHAHCATVLLNTLFLLDVRTEPWVTSSLKPLKIYKFSLFHSIVATSIFVLVFLNYVSDKQSAEKSRRERRKESRLAKNASKHQSWLFHQVILQYHFFFFFLSFMTCFCTRTMRILFLICCYIEV